MIQDGTSPVRIFGDWHTVRASIETIDGFSAHADLDGLLAWFAGLGGVRDARSSCTAMETGGAGVCRAAARRPRRRGRRADARSELRSRLVAD